MTYTWQDEDILGIARLLSADPDILGLALTGSRSRTDIVPDVWSDLDLMLIVSDGAVSRFRPGIDWLRRIGTPYASSHSSNEFLDALRVFLADGRHIDFVIVPESSLGRIDEWPHNPLAYGKRVLLSRSEPFDSVLGRDFKSPALDLDYDEQVDRISESFRFKGMLAVSKVGRGELLVALHLALDMVRDCLVLGMMLRDRETGTNHHRDGTQGTRFVVQLGKCSQPYTAHGILDAIEHSAIEFDQLREQWTPGCGGIRRPLLEYAALARSTLIGLQPHDRQSETR